MDFDALVNDALAGRAAALEALVRAIQDDVYGLAVRMLWHPDDAADATQEILVQVVTNLSSWRREASFRTWSLRIAANTLLRTRARRPPLLEPMEEGDEATEVRATAPTADQVLLAKEVRLSCSLGMLQVLDLEHRLAWVLAEVFGLTGEEGAQLLGVEAPAFRKRLSRAREKMRAVLERHCGVANPSRPCRCEKRTGKVSGLRFSTAKERVTPSVWRTAQRLAETHPTLYDHPDFAAPEQLLARLRTLLTPA